MAIIAMKIASLVLFWANYAFGLVMKLPSSKDLGLWIGLYLGYTVALPIACHLCHENALSWRGSAGVMLGVACLGGIFSWALFMIVYILWAVASFAGAAFSILIEALAAAVVYAAVIPGVTFRRGVLIYGVQCLLVLTSALLLCFGYVLCSGSLVVRDFLFP